MARKLRIAVSVFFGLLTLAASVLWMRSYFANDVAGVRVLGGRYLSFVTTRNMVFVGCVYAHDRAPNWNYFSVDAPRVWQGDLGPDWWFRTRNRGTAIGIPLWFLAGATGVFAASTWLPVHRFSLRTMLIATTLVAVVLGLAVWATR